MNLTCCPLRPHRAWSIVLVVLLCCAAGTVRGQAGKGAPPPVDPPKGPQAPAKVDVAPVARDSEIHERLLSILKATDWFTDVAVEVEEGIVFLDGHTADEQYRTWAGDLAQNTQDVVAVVNRIDVAAPSPWNFGPVWQEFLGLGDALARGLPTLILAVVVLPLAWGAGKLTASLLRAAERPRITSRLLREVIVRGAGALVFLLGLYLVLRLAGLTRLAVTVLGGTGLLGLIIGIAFRDITENFLASIFLSIQHPFREGDLVEIDGRLGLVQRLTSRTTVLMTLDGNHVQIPNATVFKTTIHNYTSNPNRREDFLVGVGYGDLIPHAQEIALQVLAEHPAVLKEPEPWVLVDNLGSATVNLRVYFWLDGSKHSWLKVRSSVIRQVKRAFQDAGISLPDEAREVILPQGVEVRVVRDKASSDQPGRPLPAPRDRTRPSGDGAAEREAVSTPAEAGLESEAKTIEEQARHAWSPEQEENLLAPGDRR
jgi:small conductance mechanosensitive channel